MVFYKNHCQFKFKNWLIYLLLLFIFGVANSAGLKDIVGVDDFEDLNATILEFMKSDDLYIKVVHWERVDYIKYGRYYLQLNGSSKLWLEYRTNQDLFKSELIRINKLVDENKQFINEGIMNGELDPMMLQGLRILTEIMFDDEEGELLNNDVNSKLKLCNCTSSNMAWLK